MGPPTTPHPADSARPLQLHPPSLSVLIAEVRYPRLLPREGLVMAEYLQDSAGAKDMGTEGKPSVNQREHII